ncbi:aspartyl/asparaginyl beta-hydroxylase domain-containing protein [Streptomyces sp. NPDC048111]|uniref:aspartyl/asparaginyl beta-hydroxylase domain-containing protein n=1 Tax=Streptomyces sp. NPDC048111 TaxID=3365500 RepID=UPI00370F955B
MSVSLDSIADLPEAARLRLSFDPDKLQRDVDQLSERPWGAQRTVVDGGELTASTEIDWRCLALRSPGGNPDRTDPGGPGTEGFADTPWLRRAPYLAEVLASIPAELRSARLMSLAPGVTVPEHRDTPTGLPYGFIRVHVPIRTNPDAILFIDKVEHRWQPGTLWYGDFSRPHSVSNTGDRTRIHLVVDCSISPELLALFPEHFQSRVPLSEVAFNRPEVPLQAFELADFHCEVGVPPCVLRLDEQLGESAEPDLPARVVEHEGNLVLEISGGPRIALVHVGSGEFRFQGWIEERGLHLDFFGVSPRAVFHTRRGRRRQQVARTAVLPQT